MILPLSIFLGLWVELVSGTSEFPNPQKEWKNCGRAKPSFICDPDFILSIEDADQLDRLAKEFRRSTSCPCPECSEEVGVSVGMYLRHNISKNSSFAYPDGKSLSEMLRRRWSLSKCDGDILIILVTQLNISDFSMGSAVQSIFPANAGAQIMNECSVHFQSGWYYQGLESILNSFNDVVVKMQRRKDSDKPILKNMLLGIGLGFLVLVILAVTAIIIIHKQQLKKSKDNCSNIYENTSPNNRRKGSFSLDEHLDKLRRLNAEDDDDDDDVDDNDAHNQYRFRHLGEMKSSVQFMRLHRQLSDVAEETSDDSEMVKRNSSQIGASNHPSKGNIPVTEL